MDKKIYIWLEKYFRLKNFRDKVIFIFLFILFISLFIYSFIYTSRKISQEIAFAQKGINNAVKIRTGLLEKRLLFIKNKFLKISEEDVGKVAYNMNFLNKNKCNDLSKNFILCKGKVYFKLKEGYFIPVPVSSFKDILNPKTGMISIYNPEFKVLIRKTNLDDICSFRKVRDANFGLQGCINKSFFISSLFKEVVKDNFILFFIFLLTSYLLFRIRFEKILLFPIAELRKKVENFDLENIDKEEFDLHKSIKDEFGYLSLTLEMMRLKIREFHNKINLILGTTTKMTSYTNDIYNFILFTANKIEDILNKIIGIVVIIYDKENLSDILVMHSNRFLKNELKEKIDNLDMLINIFKQSKEQRKTIKRGNFVINLFKKDIPENKEIIFVIVQNEDFESLDKKYIDIILLHLVYSMNLLNLANHDNLTKLLNRNALLSKIRREVKKAKRYKKDLSIILFDIDYFKNINDIYGHIVGDIILRNLSNLIKGQLREVDIIGRWGGEEFLIILPETDVEKAVEVAERLRKVIEKHVFEINGIKINLTASFGIASLNIHGDNADEIIKAVDIALYSAKKKGRNIVLKLSKEQIDEILNKEFIKYDEIKKIFEENTLVPFFQKIYDIKNDDTLGYEILDRIKTNYGYTPAANFISDIIKFGFAEKLDMEIQEKALRYIAEKNLKNYKFFFNLSRAYIHNIKNFERFLKLCSKLEIDTSQIVFEITEEEAITDINTVREIIRMAKHKNIEFALDDFGAGYSTFSYIKFFDINYIKFDGSLVRDISKIKDNKIILEGIIHISKLKNIKTIAEWVETNDDLKILENLGVDYAQGFLLSKPQKDIL